MYCSKNGIKKEGSSCSYNNKCVYPKCIINMKKEFIPYAEALALKELGFNEPCFTYYFCNGILSDTPRESGDDIKYQGDCKFDNHQNSYLEEDDNCSAPTYSQAFKWLLEKHNLYGIIIPTVTMAWTFKTMTVVIGMVEVPPYIHVDAYDYSRREEAELACLVTLIEIVKNK